MGKYKNVDDYANQMEHTAKNFLKFVFFAVMGVGLAALMGVVVKWLWNGLVTDIFDLRAISYWEGVGLFFLAKIFFGFGGGGSSSSNKKKDESVRGLVGQEIHEAMQKEFRSEYYTKFPEASADQEADNEETTTAEADLSPAEARTHNQEEEDLYDQWWASQGEKQFEDFLKNK